MGIFPRVYSHKHIKLFTLSSPTLKFIEREVGEKDKFLKMVLFRHSQYIKL